MALGGALTSFGKNGGPTDTCLETPHKQSPVDPKACDSPAFLEAFCPLLTLPDPVASPGRKAADIEPGTWKRLNRDGERQKQPAGVPVIALHTGPALGPLEAFCLPFCFL